ncbi:hypothetical protein DYB32_006921, partial [Aphanomyces invadans]
LTMRTKTRSGQSNLERGQAALAESSSRIRNLIATEDIEEIYNADQTGINHEYIPKTTTDGAGSKIVGIRCSGHEKDRITAMLLADTKGTKCPMFLVLQSKASKIKEKLVESLTQQTAFGPVVWPEIQELHERYPSRLYGKPTAWWSSEISKDSLTYHFGHRKGHDLKKFLLLWDDFSAHFCDEVVACAATMNVFLEKIPPTFTWMCQPADVAWVKPMKSARERWVTYLRHEIENHKNDEGIFQLRRPSRFDLVEWVNEAWEALPKATIVRGFVKCNLIDVKKNVPSEAVLSANNNRQATDEIASLLQQLDIHDVCYDEVVDTFDYIDVGADIE